MRLDGLDVLNFFVANLQTGFGPFVAVYLTGHGWTLVEIGVVLSIATSISLFGQVPAGALVDALANKRAIAIASLAAIATAASALAVWPERLPVVAAEGLHGLASCFLGPAIAAITLALVKPQEIAERLGRNGRFAALGSAVGAGMMGAAGTFLSSRAVFVLAALLCVPAITAVRALPNRRARPSLGPAPSTATRPDAFGLRVLVDRRLLAFAICAVLFQLANAALLPLAASRVTARAGNGANLIIAACLVVPQLLVAALAPFVGRMADRIGRRPVLLIGYCALPARALLFAVIQSPYGLVAAQALDGIGGAVFGVMVPLVCADVAGRGGRFNTCVGVIGLAVSVGAIVSTSLAGAIATAAGTRAAFFALTAIGMVAVGAVAAVMPETRPMATRPSSPAHPSPAA